MNTRIWQLDDEAATQAHAASIARVIQGSLIIYLHGELGAGKTRWSRGFLRALGWQNSVKSPTYTLIETYELARGTIYHLDLYRLADSQELEFLGLRDMLQEQSAIWLIEWPERGEGGLPGADLSVALQYKILPETGRIMTVTAFTPRGKVVLNALSELP